MCYNFDLHSILICWIPIGFIFDKTAKCMNGVLLRKHNFDNFFESRDVVFVCRLFCEKNIIKLHGINRRLIKLLIAVDHFRNTVK